MRVLEVSDKEEAAAYCGKLFGRWGAEVIKVESPSRPVPRDSLDIYLNGGKRRVGTDLHDPDDLARLRSLAAAADVLITDHAPSVIEEVGLLGLPAAVRVSITPFGLTGPYRDYEATASTLLALGGYTWLMGDPGRAPLTLPGNYPYYQAGTFAYIAALAAWLGGPEHDAPVRIDVSVLECLAGLHQFTDTMYLFGGVVRSRHGNRWENLAPTTLLRCHDGWYGINILQNFWFPFAQMIGRPDLASEGPFATNSGRMAAQDELEEIIVKALWDKKCKDIFREGQEVWRVPVGYAASLQDMLDEPHLNARGFWRDLPLGDGRVVRTAGPPFRVVGEPVPEESAPEPPDSSEAVWTQPAKSRAPQPRHAPASRPLTGVRILDLTRIWSGPLATRILGDLGAEVIKVESHDGRGGVIRRPDGSTVENHWNRQPLFNKLNRNKRSLAFDLKSAEGKEMFLRLVRVSDVVIENFSARAMPSLGLSYEAMSEANPRIIYVPMPAFGLTGPYRDYVGLGPSIEPVTGLTAILGYSEDEPRVTSKAITDAIAGSTAAAAVVTALGRRQETGEGCLIDLSQHECGVAFLGEFFIEAQLGGRERWRIANSHPQFAPHGVYACQGDDEWIALCACDEEEWRALCRVLGFVDLLEDPRFATAQARHDSKELLDTLVEQRTRQRPKRELERELQAAGVPAGSVLKPPEWLGDAHLEERGFFVELDHREAGRSRWDGIGVRFEGAARHEGWTAAPCLGEHNRSLLADLLGLTDAELDRLYRLGVLAESPQATAEE